MNIKKLFLTISAVTALIVNTQNISANNQQTNIQSQWEILYKSYATTCIAGGLIGITTGYLSNYVMRQTIKALAASNNHSDVENNVTFLTVSIIDLIAENKLRKILVNEINHSFEELSIQHKKDLTYNIAWIASWVGFLLARRPI